MHSFAGAYPVSPAQSVGIPTQWPWPPVKKHLTVFVRTSFWVFHSVPPVLKRVFMAGPHCFNYDSFTVSFEIRKRETPTLLFFKIVLPIKGPLRLHVNFRMGFSIYEKNIEVLIGNTYFLYFLIV